MGDHEITVLCYADNALLVAWTEHDLQRLLHRLNYTAKMVQYGDIGPKNQMRDNVINTIKMQTRNWRQSLSARNDI